MIARLVIATVVGVLVVERAYSIGYSRGQQSAPEYAEAIRHRADTGAALFREVAAASSPEQAVCEQIFEMVEELHASPVYEEEYPIH